MKGKGGKYLLIPPYSSFFFTLYNSCLKSIHVDYEISYESKNYYIIFGLKYFYI